MRTLDGDLTRRGARTVALVQSLAVVLGAFLVASALTNPLTAAFVDAGLLAQGGPAWEVARTIVQFVGFLLAVVGFMAVADEWDLVPAGVPDRREAALALGGAVALLVVQFAVLYLFSLVGVSTGENRAMLPGRENPTYFLYMIAVSILVVGPVEELLFRGVVQGLLRRVWSAEAAILVASAVFGLIHVVAVTGSTNERLLYATVAMLLGCLLGYLYERTDNLAVPGLSHGLYNASLFAIQYVYWAGLL